ncbi:polycomb protein SCMH1-like [Osmerus eperlanus]|uniref:polycomb protein SCMH1-like n=1 Tax=Osmerus eperlanus TaxID=29151 RepID=UPI002E0E0200
MVGPGRPVSRPRGRLPANWPERMALQQAQAEPIKIPKKRGPKPGSKRKPRVVPDPVPTSPTSSTPEPDTSSVPMDNASIPSSALQAPTVANMKKFKVHGTGANLPGRGRKRKINPRLNRRIV